MPFAESTERQGVDLAPLLSTMSNASVAIINNGWHCMDVIADEYRRALTSEYGVANVVETRVGPTEALAVEVADEIAKRCDAVVVGIGN
jgi:hypothetical protein